MYSHHGGEKIKERAAAWKAIYEARRDGH